MRRPRSLQACALVAQLGGAFRGLPSRTAEEARAWVCFSLRCLRETPTGPGSTPWEMVPDAALRQAVQAAQDWSDGQQGPPLDEASELAKQAAEAVAGSPITEAFGPAAAAWAAFQVVEAAYWAAQVGRGAVGLAPEEGDDEHAADETAICAIHAADFARRAAADGHEVEALRFQVALVGSIWPG